MTSDKKVLVIALDAAEPDLIEKWMNEGYLKNLASLRSRGAFGKLSSTADWLAGSVWPTFYTGAMPNKHGFYHYLQWKSDKMDYERPNPDWFSVVPFWRQLGSNFKVIAVDIPLTFPPTNFNGIEISGWASHDRIYPASSFPKEKINWVIKNFGNPPISEEVGGLQEIDYLLNLRKELINANQKEAKLFTTLINNEEWNLSLLCFSSTHRGGHKFWDVTNIAGNYSEEQKVLIKNSLKDIYISADKALGEILSNINDSTTILIFSLHGMGTNTTLAEKLLPQMLAKILNVQKSNNNVSFIKKIRNVIPTEWRSNLKKRLPIWLQDKMTAYWRMGGTDWSATKAFGLLADLQGYIRFNLKGREKEGVIEQGDEYNQLCNKIINGLKTFKDEDTQESVVESIERTDSLYNKGKGFNNLPDLLVKWKFKPVANYKKIHSPRYGEIEMPMPGFNFDGRSGNHRPEGFLLAKGTNIRKNSSFEKKHIVDLAPTILHLLGVPIPENYDGNVLKDILY